MEKAAIIKLTLDDARELYKSNNETLVKLALKVFPENALDPPSFNKIKSFEDAMTVLGMSIDDGNSIVNTLKETSKATAAMYKLNIIHKALNFGQNLHLTKNPKDSCIYCPCNQLVTKDTTYYVNALYSDRIDIIGKIKCEGSEYYVIGGEIAGNNNSGLGGFYCSGKIGNASASIAFFGCASYEIAKHFSKYFGTLITKAKFGDLPDFEIIEDKYGNSQRYTKIT